MDRKKKKTSIIVVSGPSTKKKSGSSRKDDALKEKADVLKQKEEELLSKQEELIEEERRMAAERLELERKDAEKKAAIEHLSALTKELIGDRSVRQAAKDTQVTASYISGITNGQFLPSAQVLKKLAAPSANPQNGITLEDLMVAAGYQEKYTSDSLGVELSMSSTETETKSQTDVQSGDEGVGNRMAHDVDLWHEETLRFENLAVSVIYRGLSEKGIRFIKAPDIFGKRGYKPDMAILLENQPIEKWWFDIKYIVDDINLEDTRGNILTRNLLNRFVLVEPDKSRKISIVTGNRKLFDKFICYKDKLSYRGDLSVILVNPDNFTVSEEVYLSHYAEQGTESEVYII